MAKEIIINTENEHTRIAIAENGELVELYFENADHERTLGDIYLGRVRKIMPSIQAAFVDIGQKQDAFLHFSDLADNLPDLVAFVDEENPEVGNTSVHSDHRLAKNNRRRPSARRSGKEQAEDDSAGEGEEGKHQHLTDSQSRSKRRSAQRRPKDKPDRQSRHEPKDKDAQAVRSGPLESYLKRDQRILVKIVKEPISNKGSRVSTDISLAGRFLVLVPLCDYVAVSKKIMSYKERRRLRSLAKSLLPEGFGVIVRTVAEGKSAKSLDTDLRLLLEKWRKLEKKLAGKPEPPVKVHEDVSMASSIIRDLFSDDYDRILVDDPRLYRNIKNYVQAVAPQMAPAVQMHKGPQHVFEAAKVAKSVAQAFESRVDLPSGGYLFIERTEAMYVVDVNSGRSGRGMSQEDNSLKVNLESARVIARQIRLRDIGGIIVVDFIDLRDDRNRQKVYDELRREFRRDRAVTKILPMSDFGLVQITRQRLRPSITTNFSAPTNGSTNKEEKEPAKERPVSAQDNRRDIAAKPAPVSESVGPEALVQRMEQWIAAYKSQDRGRAVTLHVHPFTAAYLNRRVPNLPTRWFMKHLVRVRVEVDEAMHPLSYRFVDTRSGEDVTDLPGKTGGKPGAVKPKNSARS